MITMYRNAWLTPRSVPFTEEEKQSARNAIKKFDGFLKHLEVAIEHSERLMEILAKSPATPEPLYSIRHLLRQFRDESKERFARLVPEFSGAISSLSPFEHDTDTSSLKNGLIDAVQQMSEFVENYLEEFDNFEPNQIQKLQNFFNKIKQLAQNVESVVHGRLQDHFEKNILGRQNVGQLRTDILRRARLIAMFEV
jgi:hypothetical protein